MCLIRYAVHLTLRYTTLEHAPGNVQGAYSILAYFRALQCVAAAPELLQQLIAPQGVREFVDRKLAWEVVVLIE